MDAVIPPPLPSTSSSASTAATAPDAVVRDRAGHTVVALQRTPSSPAQIRAALARAHEQLTGHPAPPALLDMLTAHCEHETGRGHAMYNFNFGGIRGAGPTGLTATSGTREVIEGQAVHVRARFRAYDSLDQGAADYLSLMNRRYDTAVDLAARGDVDGFAHALRTRGYYSASEQEYAGDLHGLLGHARTATSTGTGTDAVGSDGTTLAASSARVPFAARGGEDFSTSAQLSRVLDVIAEGTSRIAAPEREST